MFSVLSLWWNGATSSQHTKCTKYKNGVQIIEEKKSKQTEIDQSNWQHESIARSYAQAHEHTSRGNEEKQKKKQRKHGPLFRKSYGATDSGVFLKFIGHSARATILHSQRCGVKCVACVFSVPELMQLLLLGIVRRNSIGSSSSSTNLEGPKVCKATLACTQFRRSSTSTTNRFKTIMSMTVERNFLCPCDGTICLRTILRFRRSLEWRAAFRTRTWRSNTITLNILHYQWHAWLHANLFEAHRIVACLSSLSLPNCLSALLPWPWRLSVSFDKNTEWLSLLFTFDDVLAVWQTAIRSSLGEHNNRLQWFCVATKSINQSWKIAADHLKSFQHPANTRVLHCDSVHGSFIHWCNSER